MPQRGRLLKAMKIKPCTLVKCFEKNEVSLCVAYSEMGAPKPSLKIFADLPWKRLVFDAQLSGS